MSIHVCKCVHNGREEFHLRYPGMSKEAAQNIADSINSGKLTQQEPVAWIEFEGYMDEDGLMSERKVLHTWDNGKGEPLYTAPPQQEGCAECGKQASDGWALYCVKCSEPVRGWVGLTDEEVGTLTAFDGLHHVEVPLLADFILAIEAKLKEKNA
jgi:hypothetical protein